jgi:hypothetical protein
MQEVLKHDFVEYNARPYTRYNIEAILNLADFSEDEHVRTAAVMVLEYATAKFAVGSSQGRRLVPFRRLMEDVGNQIDGKSLPKSQDGTLNQTGIFESGNDHLVMGVSKNSLFQAACKSDSRAPVFERRRLAWGSLASSI